MTCSRIIKHIYLITICLFTLGLPEEKINCADPKGGYEESTCANIKYKEADKKLNQEFKKIKLKMNKEQIKLYSTLTMPTQPA